MNLEGLKKEISLDLGENENLFLHGIQNAQDEYADSIFNLGLFCYKYFSTFRTMKEIGKVKDVTTDSLDYCWCSHEEGYSVNIILAIPDFLTLDDRFLPIYPQDVTTKAHLSDDGGSRSFLDIVLGNGSPIGTIPREFVYGVYLMDNHSKRVTNLVYNPLHYTKLARKEYEQFFEKMKIKVENTVLGKCIKKYELEDLVKLGTTLKTVLFLDEGKICYETYNKMVEDLKLKKNSHR